MIDSLAAGSARCTACGAGDEPGENRAGDATARRADGAAYQAGCRTNLSTRQRNRDTTGHACSSTDSASNPPCDVARFRLHGLALRAWVSRARRARAVAKEFAGTRPACIRVRRPCLVIVEPGIVMHALWPPVLPCRRKHTQTATRRRQTRARRRLDIRGER
uniref:Uncharacterized protein n=1 Tax=Ralstonia solanacearum TaxID=305 RepID=A0A0S4VWA2_RALSL|nr:protein of unknown function [Ralstonia solanacearum]CUV36080.1 protein of unknown function [Ralstonia solanacearum]CUV38838.1 protein of unknown function [Ralstonia solanacearum]CUV63887.1 protein of unknown function [Ralstonia solanacearum]